MRNLAIFLLTLAGAAYLAREFDRAFALSLDKALDEAFGLPADSDRGDT